jgi:hypothetical protein
MNDRLCNLGLDQKPVLTINIHCKFKLCDA